MTDPAGGTGPGDGPTGWAARFAAQAESCAELGSPLWARLLALLAADCAVAGSTWELVEAHASLRFGQAGPLRLLGAAHRLGLGGAAPGWAALLPSCGGSAPPPGAAGDDELWVAWSALVGEHRDALVAGLGREVQTNEVGRAAGLGLALALAGLGDGVRLVELGCSGGLNLRLDHFAVHLDGTTVLGPPGSPVQLRPQWRRPAPGPVALPTGSPAVALPIVAQRIGLDPHPVDPTTDAGRATLLGFVWPDQQERFERVRAAVDVARAVPADLRAVTDTSAALAEVLAGPPVPTAVQHSVVWQYVPTAQRWAVTAAIEAAGERATTAAPLAWIRYEPDEWDRRRAAVWLRTWPGGADRLVAHADYHGRWLAPVGTG